MTPYSPSFFQLAAEKYQESAECPDDSSCFCGSVGRLHIDLHRLVAELALDPCEQDSENALEILVAIAVTCAACAETLIMPGMTDDEEEQD